MIAPLVLVLAQVVFWDHYAQCPPNFKPYFSYTGPDGLTYYVRYDAGALQLTATSCTPQSAGQGGPDHTDQFWGADCKIYPMMSHAVGAPRYPAPPPEANLCAAYLSFWPGVSCPTADTAAYSAAMAQHPTWRASVQAYQSTMTAQCNATPTRTRTASVSYTPTLPYPTVTPTTPKPNQFAQPIESLYHSGATDGCATNPLRYCPNDVVTRQTLAKILSDLAGLPIKPCEGIFADVPCPPLSSQMPTSTPVPTCTPTPTKVVPPTPVTP